MTTDLTLVSDRDTTGTQILHHFAECLTGIHSIGDHFVKTIATVGQDGHITVDMTRRRFGGDDCGIRVVLVATEPLPITPAPIPDTAENGQSA